MVFLGHPVYGLSVVLFTILLFSGLARLRGLALENADFTIFWIAKYLICKERRLPFWPKTAVVKTYPIPKRG
jgi:hypothetical protein